MFFQIRTCLDSKIIGIKDGLNQLTIDLDDSTDIEGKERFLKLLNHYNVKQFLTQTNDVFSQDYNELKGKLRKNAKLTDVMEHDVMLWGSKFVVSEKFKNLLVDEKICEQEYKLFPVEIEGLSEDYYLLYIPMISLVNVVFRESSIYLTKHISPMKSNYELPILDVKTYEDYKVIEGLNKFRRICLPKEYGDKDILSVQGAVLPYFSKRLVEKMIELAFSNVQVLPIDALSNSHFYGQVDLVFDVANVS